MLLNELIDLIERPVAKNRRGSFPALGGEESPRLVDRLCARCRDRINEAQRRNGRR